VTHTPAEVEPGARSSVVVPPSWATLTFVVLFAMNLLDYMDRNILYAVLKQVKASLQINSTQAGSLATFFLISYAVVSPVMGWLGDRWRRTWLLGIGVGVWSVATIGTGLAQTFGQLVLARCFLGIGEATYGVIAPTLLMDLFPREKRARVMSAFYLAMPVGSALGTGLGGTIATRFNWHAAFFVVGAPGLLAAFAALLLPEPVRGASEGIDVEQLKTHERAGATKEDYVDLLVNSSYTYSVFGMAAYTFAIGGLLVWVPTFLTVTRGIDQERANWLLGLTTLVAAIAGMSLGGWVADRWSRTNPRALFVVPGVAMIGSLPFILLAMFARETGMIFVGIFFAEMLMFVNTGPCNAVIANVVAPNMRAAAYAAAVFAIHFLGDIWSPTLMGWVADTFGQADSMETAVGRALSAIGAVPTVGAEGPPVNLLAGLLVVVPAILISGLVLLAGARHLPREMALMLAKLKAAPPKLAMTGET
jgi:MFS family permease